MMPIETNRQNLETQIQGLIESAGLLLHHTEVTGNDGRTIFRIFIDHLDGVTLKHCETVSRKISYLLDTEDPFSGKYQLEVSSPGIYRELLSEEEYQRFMGNRVKIFLKEKDAESRQRVTGKIENISDEYLTIVEQDGRSISFERKNIEKVRLSPEF